MHKLYELKEMLCKELDEYGSKEKLDVGALEIIDKLSHAIKNIDKIIESEESEEYSERGNYYRGGMYRDSYRDGGNSYARGRGRNARRDSRGRYASYYEEEMVDQLREMMQNAPDQQTRQKFERFIQEMEQM